MNSYYHDIGKGRKYCIYCGAAYGSPHAEMCTRYSSTDSELTRLRSENEELKKELEMLFKKTPYAAYRAMKEKVWELEEESEFWIERAHSVSVHALDVETENKKLEVSLAAAVEALEIISGQRQCVDNTLGNREIAELALANLDVLRKEGE